jgi:hypothetical protein
VQSVVESAQLAGQIDRGQSRWWSLSAAAVVHMARGQPALATRALGASDAHTPSRAGVPGEGWGLGFLAEATAAMRARLDAAEVASAAAAARRRRLDQLIDELVVHGLSTPA